MSETYLNRQQMHKVLAAALSEDEFSRLRWRQTVEYIRRLETALEKIATGEISGAPTNYKDTLVVCREVAKEALK